MSNRRRPPSRRQGSVLGTIVLLVVLLAIYLVLRNLGPNGSSVTNSPANPAPTRRPSANAPANPGPTRQRSTNRPSSAGKTGQRASANANIALGNPSGATPDPANADNYLIARDQYVLSYNRGGGIPNWVSWHLSAADMGPVGRGDFQPDTSLPKGWYEVTPSDYTNSGYDRGHMAPSADRTATQQDNAMMFLMTNIVPQAPDNNQGPWVQLEEYCRDLARQGNELYLVAGVQGQRGVLRRGNVRVPESLWKVVVVLPEGDNDLQRVTDQTKVFAVDMPNRQGIRNTDWKQYLTSVDKLQQATGYDLLSNVNPAVQMQLEAKVGRP